MKQPFRITAQCSNCYGQYDATAGLECPACRCPHPIWARREDMHPYYQLYYRPDFKKHDAEIAWCEKLLALEDPRA